MHYFHNHQTFILKGREQTVTQLTVVILFFQNITNSDKISTSLLNLLKKRNKLFIQIKTII